MCSDKDSKALVCLSFSANDPSDADKVKASLDESGYGVTDLKSSELAKAHLRYLGGGRSKGEVRYEKLYRFLFPERPAALTMFLETLQASKPAFNISLFHYRNVGSDHVTVLAGIQVDPKRAPEFEAFLEDLGYAFVDESENPVYTKFLK